MGRRQAGIRPGRKMTDQSGRDLIGLGEKMIAIYKARIYAHNTSPHFS